MSKQVFVHLPVVNVGKTIHTFLEYKGERSDNTKKSYEADIKLFFQIMRNKELNELSIDDLHFTKELVINYRKHLQRIKDKKGGRKYSNRSINRKIKSLSSLFGFLLENGYEVNKFAFNLDDLPENETEEIGYLTLNEVESMVQIVKDHPNGLEKSIFWELAWKTSLRLEALLSLCWKDFKKVDNDDIWLVKAIDKGNKKREMPITDDFYQRILQIKGDKKKDDKVFSFGKTTVHKTMELLKEQLQIDEDRNVSFHSLRKFLIDWLIEQGDLKGAALHAGHASIETAWKHYSNKHRNYRSMAGILIEQKRDVSILENLSKEELIAVIKDSNQFVQSQIIKTYEQMIHYMGGLKFE